MDYTYISPEENEDKVVIFTIGEKQMIMSETEYNKHIEEGRINPVLVGETLHMVNNEDFKIIKKVEKSLDDMTYAQKFRTGQDFI